MWEQKTSQGASLMPNIINNEVISLPESQNFPIIQASTGTTVHYAQSATVDIGIKAVETAAKAFKTWKKTTILHRQALLNKVAETLLEKLQELTKRETTETSCDPGWPQYEGTAASKL
jgi:acyl-CoA reductase-like NAD-dependent aldehyde dehydrogenase